MSNKPENLKPFLKGHDPRRSPGKPKGSISITTILKQISKKRLVSLDDIEGCKRRMTVAEKIAIKLISKAMDGDMQALKEYNDRLDGKSMQHVELGGPGGGPLTVIPIQRIYVNSPQEIPK